MCFLPKAKLKTFNKTWFRHDPEEGLAEYLLTKRVDWKFKTAKSTFVGLWGANDNAYHFKRVVDETKLVI